MPNNSVLGMLKGVAAIIGCMDHGEVPTALGQLCKFQTTPLCELIAQNVTPTRGTKCDPVLWFDRLAAIFRNINIRLDENTQNPCKSVAIEVSFKVCVFTRQMQDPLGKDLK